MTDLENKKPADREQDEAELETYGVAVCRKCGAELTVMAECYPTECGECGGQTFYPIRPKQRKPDKAAFLPNVGVIDDYTL